MTHKPRAWLRTAALLAGSCLSLALAQEEDERLSAGVPLENEIAGRDVALRLRAEVQSTHDADELLENDPAFQLTPQRMLSGEVRAFHRGGATAYGSYDEWEQENGRRACRASAGAGIPLPAAWRADVHASYWGRELDPDSRYYYAAAGRRWGSVYAYTQYRLSFEGQAGAAGDTRGHQALQYLSWMPRSDFRAGGQVAYAWREGGDDACFAQAFAVRTFAEDRTALRVEVLEYCLRDQLTYQEYRTFLYQRLANRWMLRLGYRYYNDNRDRDSHAPGVKLTWYASPRIQAHAGYTRYARPGEADFDSYMAGVSWLL